MTYTNRELHGIDEPLEEEVLLRAGPFEAVFEPARAYLRRIRINGVESVRNIYVHVRAPEWETIVPVVTMLDQRVGTDFFELTWKGVHRTGEVSFEWIGTLTGSPSGIHYRCEGEALSTFRTNRTSLCVLIPREFRGLNADITHSDTSQVSVALPDNIAPQQPLKAMHAVAIGPVKLTFEGAEFDAEDQRNWTDASFKAYPANSRQPETGLKKGDKIIQGVRVEATGGRVIHPVSPRDVDASHSVGPFPRPSLGATIANDHDDLAGLHVNFLRVLLPADSTAARHVLEHARSAGLPLQIVVPRGAEIPSVRDSEILIADGAAVRPQVAPSVWLEAGSFDNFNMGRHSVAGFDGVEVSGTPQIHTFDERSILDNAATLFDVVRSLYAIGPGKAIGLTIHMKGDGPDPRLESLFGALWILRCFAAVCSIGSPSLTLGATNELQFPPIAALIKEITASDADYSEIKGIEGELVMIQGPCTIIGNLLRQPRVVLFSGKVQSADKLGPHGWFVSKFISGDELGPYEIVKLNLEPKGNSGVLRS